MPIDDPYPMAHAPYGLPGDFLLECSSTRRIDHQSSPHAHTPVPRNSNRFAGGMPKSYLIALRWRIAWAYLAQSVSLSELFSKCF